MRCIAVINQKGGVGKTTTTVNLGAALARRGQKVLLLDLDPQANLSLHIDRQPETEVETVTYLMVENKPIAELMRATESENLWVIPADSSLGGVEQVLANRIGREMILRELFAAYDADPNKPVDFDFILLDCPPSLGVLSANALVAAGEVVIPMQAEYFSLQGMAKLTEVIALVRDRLNPEIEIALVLPCMLDTRKRLTAEVLEEIRRHFGGLMSQFPIRPNVKLAEAPSFGRTIFEHAPESNGAEDYDGVAAELLGVADELLAQFESEEELEADEEVDADAEDVEAELEADAAEAPVVTAQSAEADTFCDEVEDFVAEPVELTEPMQPEPPRAAEELEPEPEPDRARPPMRPVPLPPPRPKETPSPKPKPEPVREVPHEIVRPREQAIEFRSASDEVRPEVPVTTSAPTPPPAPLRLHTPFPAQSETVAQRAFSVPTAAREAEFEA